MKIEILEERLAYGGQAHYEVRSLYSFWSGIPDLEQWLKTHVVCHMLVHIHSDSDSDDQIFPTTITSDNEFWEQPASLDMQMNPLQTPHPTCTPQLFGHHTRETEDSRQPLKRAKFYILYTGDSAGMYRDWGEVSARTNKVSGALHQSFHSWEEAVEAWKQYCLSHHDHPADMQDGTVYNPVQSTPPPRSVSPPHNNVCALSIARQHVHAPATPTRVAGTSTRHVAESPCHDIFSSARSHHGSPSKKRVATAFYSPESPPRQPVSSPRPPLWARDNPQAQSAWAYTNVFRMWIFSMLGNKVEQCGNKVEQCGNNVEQCGNKVEQCGNKVEWDPLWRLIVELGYEIRNECVNKEKRKDQKAIGNLSQSGAVSGSTDAEGGSDASDTVLDSKKDVSVDEKKHVAGGNLAGFKWKGGNPGNLQGVYLEYLQEAAVGYLCLESTEKTRFLTNFYPRWFDRWPWHTNDTPEKFQAIEKNVPTASNPHAMVAVMQEESGLDVEDYTKLVAERDTARAHIREEGHQELKNWFHRQTGKAKGSNIGVYEPFLKTLCKCRVAAELYEKEMAEVRERIKSEIASEHEEKLTAYKQLMKGDKFVLDPTKHQFGDIPHDVCHANLAKRGSSLSRIGKGGVYITNDLLWNYNGCKSSKLRRMEATGIYKKDANSKAPQTEAELEVQAANAVSAAINLLSSSNPLDNDMLIMMDNDKSQTSKSTGKRKRSKKAAGASVKDGSKKVVSEKPKKKVKRNSKEVVETNDEGNNWTGGDDEESDAEEVPTNPRSAPCPTNLVLQKTRQELLHKETRDFLSSASESIRQDTIRKLRYSSMVDFEHTNNMVKIQQLQAEIDKAWAPYNSGLTTEPPPALYRSSYSSRPSPNTPPSKTSSVKSATATTGMSRSSSDDSSPPIMLS
ncbi:hypothetical protein D9758_018727 [Tetrapyrgos nigripes]|uniref:Ribonuclease H1 N-terminal domain-containing protein n=1 Tax=Tetrapyrgos nigripes TaxID=182062 RepID=A0A8H5FAN2_9AGAR|nr:hypothetical protein D9758_018727 [Tetrapyrgos nigripes]